MLDESTMEKKATGRSTSSKPNGSDSKVKQDATPKYPRSTKQRENLGVRSEPIRKPTPQRSRTTNDKRPRARCGVNIIKNSGPNYNGDRSQIVEDMGAEVGSAQNPGSKKINLNHLLNFSFTPRECGYGGNLQYKRGAQRRSTLPTYNKEKFLQANYQFIVRKNGNYTVHSVDPDILVDWSLVEEVRVPSYEVPSCPICLYPPTAAKITRCGHIYCWSCMLHYLSLSDKSWRKCPICYEAVHKDDLKSVDFVSKITQKIGDNISLSLMRRDKGCVFAVPVTHWNGVIEKPFYIDEVAATTCFQKLLLASPEQVNTILNRERNEMLAQLKEESDTPESCFIESALQILDEREKALHKQQLLQDEASLLMTQFCISETFSSHVADDARNVAASQLEKWKIEKHEKYVDPFADENDDVVNLSTTGGNENADSSTSVVTTDEHKLSNGGTGSNVQICEQTSFLELNNPQNCTDRERIDTKKLTRENYYFYQASDGQNIFLHALNVRMLVKEYGSLENSPTTITAKIVDFEGASMDEASRKRMRYLRHLPMTCEFQFVELELKPPVVSKATVDLFMSEIVKRRRLRSRKARQEKNREKYIEKVELKKLGISPGARFHLDSLHHFPTWTSSENDNLDIQHLTDVPPFRPEEESISSDTSSATDLVLTAASESLQIHSFNNTEDNSAVRPTSFAEMLRESKSKHDHWRQPVKQQGKQTASHDIKDKETGSTEDFDEDYVAVPEYHQSFSDAFQAALDSISQQNTSQEQEQCKGKKKKKVKKMVLIATTMNRGK